MAERPGFIAVYRKIQDHWVWDDPERFHAWIDILMSAQFADSETIIKGHLVRVPRGTWFISQKTLETRWGWSKNKIRHFLQTLIEDEMVTVKGTADGTFITVVNYEFYQNQGTAKGTAEGTPKGKAEGTAEGTAEGKHNNKENKGNKENKKNMASFLRKCTFEEDEIERFMQLCEDHKSPFPNVDVENEYFKVAMAKREERESNG